MATNSSPSPDGPPLFGLKFNDLDIDCLLEVFKLLPFIEKIKYQRVNSRWGDLFGSIWTKQTVLSFSKDACFGIFCRQKGHYFGDRFDRIDLKEKSHEKQAEIWDTLTRRCPRLKAVFWDTRDFAKKRLNCLLNCSRLEHLALNIGELLMPVLVINISLVNIKCLKLSVHPKTRAIVLNLVKNCPQLEALHLEFIDFHGVDSRSMALEMLNILTPVLPYLLELLVVNPFTSVGKVGSILLQTIASLGQNIKTLYYSIHRHEAFSVKTEGDLLQNLVQKMPKLEKISFLGCPENLIRLLSSKRLKHIIWTNSCFFPLQLSPLIGLISLHLSILLYNQSIWGEVLKVPQYYPNLEELRVGFRYRDEPRANFPDDYFVGLKRLKRLYLVNCDLSHECVKFMLGNCPKVVHLDLTRCYTLSPDTPMLIVDYLVFHVKRRIVLNLLDCKFDETRELDPEVPRDLQVTLEIRFCGFSRTFLAINAGYEETYDMEIIGT